MNSCLAPLLKDAANPDKLLRMLTAFLKEKTRPDEMIELTNYRKTFSSRVASGMPSHLYSTKQFNKHIRATAPISSKVSLDFFVDESGDRIHDDEAMARELKTVWEPIWAPKGASSSRVFRYLSVQETC